jgi:hypothetical protein
MVFKVPWISGAPWAVSSREFPTAEVTDRIEGGERVQPNKTGRIVADLNNVPSRTGRFAF